MSDAGRCFCSSAISRFTDATVLMMLAPMRLRISRVTAGLPSMRANPVGSLKARRTVATSPKVTTVPLWTLMGMVSMSFTVSMTPGTLIAKRPAPVSSAPAAMILLLRWTSDKSVSKERL